MAGKVLRHAVDDEVGAELERLLEQRRRERVVDDEQGAGLVRRRPDRGDVVHEQTRVRRRFDPHQLGLARERRLQRGRVADVDLADYAAERLEDAIENAIGATVDIERDHDLVAGAQIRLQDRVLGRQARGKQRGVLDTLELGEDPLEPRARGIVRSRVVEAVVIARRVLLVGRGLEDRGDQGSGFGLRRLAGVNGLGGELHGSCSLPH